MPSVVSAVFPHNPCNNYQGHRIALWAFGILTVVMYVRSSIHAFKEDSGAQSIATIPLDKYPKACAKHIVQFSRLWGQQQLLTCFVYTTILTRYRTLLPFAILIWWIENIMRLAETLLSPEKMSILEHHQECM